MFEPWFTVGNVERMLHVMDMQDLNQYTCM